MQTPKYTIVWDNNAKEDLKIIYTFNKKNFSLKFAKEIRDKIYKAVGGIVFLEQWQKDEILGDPYRRIIVSHYKICYLVKNEKVYILLVFDTRQDPVKYKL